MSQKEIRKAERERQIFAEFAQVAGLNVDPATIESRTPPDADIRCQIAGSFVECEMGEITDIPVAWTQAEALKTGEATGAAFSHDEPLFELFEEKAKRTYRTSGIPLFFVAYYDKQYPPPEYDLAIIPDTIGDTARRMIGSGAWDRIYVYDTWEHRLLWRLP